MLKLVSKFTFIVTFFLVVTLSLSAQNYDLLFDGVNDYVEVSNVDDFRFLNESFTISCWLQIADNNNTYRSYVCLIDSDENPRVRLLKYRSGWAEGRLQVEITAAAGQSRVRSLDTGATIPKNEWLHFAAVADYDAGLLIMYINGVFQNSDSLIDYDFTNAPNLRLTFGRDMVFGHILNSYLDEVRIFKAAVDQTTIQNWMDQPLNASHPNWSDLIGYWKFNEGSGQIAHDSSGNGNDGQLGSTGSGDTNDPSWGLSDNPLPIELTSFQAIQTTAGFAQINWTTQSESNLWGYNIYRSQDNELETSFMLNPTIIAAENSPTGFEYAYTDKEVETENTYYYWLESVDLSGNTEFFGPTQITIETEQLPEPITETNLMANYPNPFNPTTTIKFNIKENETGILTIYNTKGQLLESHQFSSGNHNYVWQADEYTSGVYFYKLQTDSYSKIKKMILMK